MRKQWTLVIVIVLGLGIGAWALTHFGNRGLPAEVGSDAPNFRALNLKTGDTVSLGKTYKGQVVLVNISPVASSPRELRQSRLNCARRGATRH